MLSLNLFQKVFAKLKTLFFVLLLKYLYIWLQVSRNCPYLLSYNEKGKGNQIWLKLF